MLFCVTIINSQNLCVVQEATLENECECDVHRMMFYFPLQYSVQPSFTYDTKTSYFTFLYSHKSNTFNILYNMNTIERRSMNTINGNEYENQYPGSSSSSTYSNNSNINERESNSRIPLHINMHSHDYHTSANDTANDTVTYTDTATANTNTPHCNTNTTYKRACTMLTLAACLLQATVTHSIVINVKQQPQLQQLHSSQRNALALLNTVRHIRHKKGRTKSSLSSVAVQQVAFPKKDTSWKNLFDDDYEFDLDNLEYSAHDAFISSRVEAHLPSVKSLRTSLGSEIPDMELYLQMEAAKVRAGHSHDAAAAFINLHHARSGAGSRSGSKAGSKSSGSGARTVPRGLFGGETTSAVEKVAMRYLPSQLPELATAVLSRENAPDLAAATKISTRASTSLDGKAAASSPVKTKPRLVRVKRIVLSGNGDNVVSDGTGSTVVRKSMIRPSSGTTATTSNDIGSGNGRAASTPTNHLIQRIKSKDVSTIMRTRKALQSNADQRLRDGTSRRQVPQPLPPHPHVQAQSESKHSASQSHHSARVSHDEEIQLARIIQRGVEMHNIKSQFEGKHGRDITRQEWAELAELESPKQLRRMVSDYRQAKNKLVMANMGLVHAIVRTRMGITGGSGNNKTGKDGITYEEMVQEGSLGLLRAAELFDPSRGLRFSTYATIWIKGVLGNSSISETITVPLRERAKWNKIKTAIADLQMEFGAKDAAYRPSHNHIAEKSGLDIETVKQVVSKMTRAKNVLSLDYQYETQGRSGGAEGKYEALNNDKNLMDDVDLVQRLHVRADVIAAIVRNLDPREARLIRLRYGLNDGRTRSIKDCAEAMGISHSLAQQLAAGCLKKLREADDAESLQEYLLSVA